MSLATTRNAKASPSPSASFSPENISFLEAPSEEGLEISLDRTKLKINPNAVSGKVRLKASIAKFNDPADPTVVLAGGEYTQIDVINAETGQLIQAGDIVDSFIVYHNISDRSGQRNDLVLIGPNGEREYIKLENLQGSAQLNLASVSALDQIIFKIPDMADVGVRFWIADFQTLDESFSEKQVIMSASSTTGGILQSSTSGVGSSSSSSSGGSGTGGSSGDGPDEIAPTITQVSSNTANGAYKAGSTISIQISFSEAVEVSGGTPHLVLETGGTDRNASYISGSGTDVLNFSYTVQAGDISADLEVTSTGALVLNGALIQDAAGNDAVLTLPSLGGGASLSGLKNIVIDTAAPPALTNLSGSASASVIQLSFDWPAERTDYNSVVVRRTTGASAPADCASGSVRTTITNFNTDPHTFNDSAPVGTYSYRVCIYDAAGNFISETENNITVSSSNSWGTATSFSVTNTSKIKVAISSSANTAAITYRESVNSGVNDDLYHRSWNGSSWSGATDDDPGGAENTIPGFSIFYDSNDSLKHIYDGQNFCQPLKQNDNFEVGRGNCGGVPGPSSKYLAYSKTYLGGVIAEESELALFSGSTWSTIPLNTQQEALGLVDFDYNGSVVGVFHNGSGSTYFRRWNPSGTPTHADWDDEATLPDTLTTTVGAEMRVSASGALGFFVATQPSPTHRLLYAKRRTTGGTWQSNEILASNTSGDTYKFSAGVDASGRMIVFYQYGTSELLYKIFNGSSWGSENSLSSNEVAKMAACSHPDSDDIFLVWTSFSTPQNVLYGIRMSNGTLESGETALHGPSGRYIDQIDIACNAAGQAIVGYYQYNTQGPGKEYGAVIYGP